ncbi:hypothetical protein PVAP13_5NG481300 [Panicum virgatum]|uniref:Uncharacterized protein n=1 Tax=Panicum virgatum TaxID=38727 RepID=A0A8T0S2Z4_PANVG|nr:hypothetical protein PVAP13_5NG481300 [Panicum virgatum]
MPQPTQALTPLTHSPPLHPSGRLRVAPPPLARADATADDGCSFSQIEPTPPPTLPSAPHSSCRRSSPPVARATDAPLRPSLPPAGADRGEAAGGGRTGRSSSRSQSGQWRADSGALGDGDLRLPAPTDREAAGDGQGRGARRRGRMAGRAWRRGRPRPAKWEKAAGGQGAREDAAGRRLRS